MSGRSAAQHPSCGSRSAIEGVTRFAPEHRPYGIRVERSVPVRTPGGRGWWGGGRRPGSDRWSSPDRGGDAAPPAALVERDVPYCSPRGVEQTLDLYRSTSWHGHAAAVVLYVHGGAWRQGDKAGAARALAARELLRRGYVIAALNYRLMPRSPFPAQI